MPIERTAALRHAEQLLRQGKLDLALAEYLGIIEEQPRDWSTSNIVGDLYVRLGQVDTAVAQFVQLADGLAADGFLAKAAAVYKKVLKLKTGDEHALLQSAELALKQGLLADACNSLNEVAERRRTRGDHEGAEHIALRVASLTPRKARAERTVEPPPASKDGPASPEYEIDTDSRSSSTDAPLVVEALAPPPVHAQPVDTGPEGTSARRGDDASRRRAFETAEAEYQRGVVLHRAGRIVECIEALHAAAHAPSLGFATASLLASIYRDRGLMQEAIEWLERAAEAPAPTPDEGRRLLYELADALESVGELSRALAVGIELQAEAGEYRDIGDRVDRLAKLQSRG